MSWGSILNALGAGISKAAPIVTFAAKLAPIPYLSQAADLMNRTVNAIGTAQAIHGDQNPDEKYQHVADDVSAWLEASNSGLAFAKKKMAYDEDKKKAMIEAQLAAVKATEAFTSTFHVVDL